MKIKTPATVSAVLALSVVFTQAAPLGTAFTYQGNLTVGANAANGNYDLKFTVHDAASGSFTVAGPITNSPVRLTNGLFTTTLDFGSGVFTGDARWLEIGARTNGSASDFTTLAPRQLLTPAPSALWATTANSLAGVLPSGQLAGPYGNALTFNNPANSFAGNGAGLTSLSASQLTTGTMADARLSANVALRSGGNYFTGSQTFADGNVHIGAVGPGALLGLQGDLGADQYLLYARGSHTAGSWLSLENTTTGGKRWDLVATGSANGEGPGKLLFYQSGLGDVMALTTAGWLGVGTASPTALLGLQGHAGADQFLAHARGSHTAGSWFSLENTATGGNRWDFVSTGPGNGEGAGKLLFRESGAGSVLTLTTNGSVGINNTSPQAALDLVTHAADQYAVNLKNVAANGWTIISLKDGAGRFGNIDFNYGPTIDGYKPESAPQIGFYMNGGAYFVLRGPPYDGGNAAVYCNTYVSVDSLFERSDRNSKTAIEAVHPAEVLERVLSLPVSTWAFTNAVNTRHIGPMAQDFHAAFGLGDDDKTIGPRDANGVALAAIQGLNQKLEEKNAVLEKQVAELSALVKSLAEKVNGGAK